MAIQPARREARTRAWRLGVRPVRLLVEDDRLLGRCCRLKSSSSVGNHRCMTFWELNRGACPALLLESKTVSAESAGKVGRGRPCQEDCPRQEARAVEACDGRPHSSR